MTTEKDIQDIETQILESANILTFALNNKNWEIVYRQSQNIADLTNWMRKQKRLMELSK